MNRQAPPQTAGPRSQLLSRKTIYGSAAFAFAILLSILLGPAAMGVLLFGVVAVICSQNSLKKTERGLVVRTRLHTASNL